MSDNADMKMAYVFNLPLSDDGADAHDENFNYVLECKSTIHAQYAAQAINTHDNLVKERDEWKEAAEYNYNLYSDLMSTIADKEDTLTAENKALREALQQIEEITSDMQGWAPSVVSYKAKYKLLKCSDKARAALKLGEGQ